MSYIMKPKIELLDNLELIMSRLFPPPLPREIKYFISNTDGCSDFREENLDSTEGLIVRISRCDTFNAMADLVDRASLPVKACLWERFLFVKRYAQQHSDDPQMVPTPMGRYLRETLSGLWHSSRDMQ